MKIHYALAGLLLMLSSGLAFASSTADSSDDQTISASGDPTMILPDLYAALQKPAGDQDSLSDNPNSLASPNNHPTFQEAQQAAPSH